MRAQAKLFRDIIKATFPGYSRREVIVEASTKVTFYNLNWDGGSRNEYRACTIDGKPLENKVDLNGPAPWYNKGEGKTIDLPEGFLIVQGGYFCGKPSLLHIHVNPANMPKLLN